MMVGLFGQLFSQVVGGFQPSDPFFAEMRDWSAQLAQQAIARWQAVMTSGIPCACEPGCRRPAIGGCVICGGPTCLAHSLVASSAEVACFRCIRTASTANGRTPPPRAAAPPSQGETRKAHLKTLGLKDPATADEIKRAFKVLAAKHHPDRIPAARRAAAESRMKSITEAYHWLTREAS